MSDAILTALSHPGLFWLLAAASLAGFVRGFSGFGAGLVFMPLATVVVSPTQAIVLLLAVDGLGSVGMIPKALRLADKREVSRLGVGMLIGVPLGIYALNTLPTDPFRWLISIGIFAVLLMMVKGVRLASTPSPRLTYSTGAASGFLGAAFGLAAPPILLLYLSGARDPAQIRANTFLFLSLIIMSVLGLLALQGAITAPLLWMVVTLLPVYVIGNVLGAALFAYSAGTGYKMAAYILIAVAAFIALPIFN